MKEVIVFLKKNGFKRMETNSYANDMCNVVFMNLGYSIADNDGNEVFFNDNSIHRLVGYLTWMGYMDKNYKQ